jgi:hypothetical protein
LNKFFSQLNHQSVLINNIKNYVLFVFFSLLFSACSKKGGETNPIMLAPTIAKSEIYQVLANKIDIPVGHEISNDTIFETTMFTLSGNNEVEVVVKDPIESYSIHPLSKNIKGTKDGNKLSFEISEPANLMVKINDNPPLLLFVTPKETNIPNPEDENVLYFGPGTHDIGRLQLKDNQTVYIAGGARVYGTLEGYEVKNVKIMGRGILDGSKHTSWEKRIFGIYFERSENITIEGIGIRENYWWVTEFLLCKNVNISNINLFSFNRNNGGLMMDGCQGFTARDSFILTHDDCICPHALNAAGNGEPIAENYLFENLVLYNVLSGNGIRIGASFETESVRNWKFKNIDVIAHTAGAALYADHSDWANVEDLSFINFYDEQAHNPTVEFFIDSTRYSCFTGYKNERGNMNNVIFKNLNSPGGDIILKGYDSEHRIHNVYFIDSQIGGDFIDSKEDISTNEFVTNVHFGEKEIKNNAPAKNEYSELKATSPEEFVIDNGDPNYKSFGFEHNGSEPNFTDNDFDEATVPDGFSNFKAAIYTPNIAGKYDIFIHWGDAENKATNSRWLVSHQEGFNTKYFDQNNSEGWHHHGTYSLNQDSYVRLALPGYLQIADGNVMADAVKFVKVPIE